MKQKRKSEGAKPFKTIEQQNREKARKWRDLANRVKDWAAHLHCITDVPDMRRAEAILHAHLTVYDLEKEVALLTPKLDFPPEFD